MKKIKNILTALFMSAMVTNGQQFSTLRGTSFKVNAAYNVAVDHDYTLMKDAVHVQKFVRLGLLVKLTGNQNYSLSNVSYPYARPAAKLLVERLSAQYRKANGEKLVVTSATRVLAKRLWNSSSKSVHPAGIAIDFRVPSDPKSRKWLESSFLTMQRRGDIIATREYNPPHYHIVVVPRSYKAYVARQRKK